MPSQPPIPHLLSPYLTHSTHSAQSLTIITSVLAATPNWLILRYLHSVLLASPDYESHQESGSAKKRRRRRAKRVVLVSFLREWLFWRGEGKRLGLDLQRFVDGDRLRFVDGLSGLFDASQQTQQQPQQAQQQQGSIRSGPAMGSVRSIPMRGPASPRAPPPPSAVSAAATPSQAKTPTPQHKQLHISGQGIATLNQLENDILSVINSLPKPNGTNDTSNEDGEDDGDEILLILDQPDIILATTPGIDANDISEWVIGLQQHVLSTIITTSADSPLIHNANPYTLTENVSAAASPLEKNHASFLVGLAHRADMVLQLRTLDTGAAKDVSGVLRMSRGGGYDEPESEGGKEDGIADKEVLYFVQRDGGVRVFGRGEV